MACLCIYTLVFSSPPLEVPPLALRALCRSLTYLGRGKERDLEGFHQERTGF